jgi:hypothetical protein
MSKYGAKRTTVDGINFDSQAESRRYGQLKLLQQAGEIQDLICHPRFLIYDGVTREGKRERIWYEGDFEYREDGARVVEDVKGGTATITPMFRLKKKMFLCQYHDIEFRVVQA